MNTVTAPKKNGGLIALACILAFLIAAMAVVYFVSPPSAARLNKDLELDTRLLFEDYFEASYYTDKVISTPQDFNGYQDWQSGLKKAQSIWENTKSLALAISSSLPDEDSLFSFLDEVKLERTAYADSLFDEYESTDDMDAKLAMAEEVQITIFIAADKIAEDAKTAIRVLDNLNRNVHENMEDEEILQECESASKLLIKNAEFNVTFGVSTAKGGIMFINNGSMLAVAGADILLIDDEAFLSSAPDFAYIRAIPNTSFPEGKVTVISSRLNNFIQNTNSKIDSKYDNLAFTVDPNGVTEIKSLTDDEFNSYVLFLNK